MPTLTVNGSAFDVRLIEVELPKLRLDPENPRLHLFYLTHELPSEPTQAKIAAILESLPEFQSLVDSIVRNNGCFHPPLVTTDLRILEGNRRVAALRKLSIEHPQQLQWQKLTVQQFGRVISTTQEKAVRAKYHLEEWLPWDGLSILTEYLAVAERDGIDALASMLGRFRRQLEPLLVAGQCLAKFSQTYPQVHQQELLWVLVALCGIKQITPKLTFARATRCIYSAQDQQRPAQQPFPLDQIMRWLVEGRFTKPYQYQQHLYEIRPAQVPLLFRQVRQAGEEILAYFLEPDGSLAKAIAYLDAGQRFHHHQQRRALALTNRYMELLNEVKSIRRDDNPDLYREAMACYHRLEQLLGLKRKEQRRVHKNRHQPGGKNRDL